MKERVEDMKIKGPIDRRLEIPSSISREILALYLKKNISILYAVVSFKTGGHSPLSDLYNATE